MFLVGHDVKSLINGPIKSHRAKVEKESSGSGGEVEGGGAISKIKTALKANVASGLEEAKRGDITSDSQQKRSHEKILR